MYGRGRGRGGAGRGGAGAGTNMPFRPAQQGGGGGGRGGYASTPAVFRQDVRPEIDQKVTAKENQIVARAKQTIIKNSKSLAPAMPERPAYGLKGKTIVVWANYFNLGAKDGLAMLRYSISITEDGSAGSEPKGRMAKRIVALFIEDCLNEHRRKIATDFKSNLISMVELIKDGDRREFVVRYRDEGEDAPSANAKAYRIKLQKTGPITAARIIEYLNSVDANTSLDSIQEAISALNIVAGHYPKSTANITSVGANKHFRINPQAEDSFDLGAGLMAIRGFFLSVRAATGRLLVNVQVKNGAFYKPLALPDLLTELRNRHRWSDVQIDRFLRKVRVSVSHLKKTNKAGQPILRVKQICGFSTTDDGQGLQHPPHVPRFASNASQVEFWLDSVGVSGTSAGGGRYITVQQFFKQAHNMTLRGANLPVVNVGQRGRPIYLPAEVCTVLPGQAAAAKLSPEQTANMIKFAVRRPHLNAESIVKTGNNMLQLQNPKNETLNSFGLDIVPKMIAVPARVLMPPDIKYSGSSTLKPRWGSWNLAGVKVVKGMRLDGWSCLRLAWEGGPGNPPEIEHKLQEFPLELRKMGVAAAAYTRYRFEALKQATYEEIVMGLLQAAHKIAGTQLLLIILPEANNARLYNIIKKGCDVVHGHLNVCVTERNFMRGNSQYFANVGLKVNLKLGGKNHVLPPAKLGIVGEKKTMVVGIDVTHPSPGSTSTAPSVAAVVASIDSDLAQWPASIRVQERRQEMVQHLEEMFKSRLALWRKHNNLSLPENIIVYRDGVSEGQYQLVLDNELPALRKACESIYPASMTRSKLPRISIIVVGKRHHTRFFATSEENMDRSGNPQSGTIVDRGVTQAWLWDFFLQAHTALQGTARPGHYYVIYDEIFRARYANNALMTPADALEDLTHNMCYLFGRATKAVSLCPPAYYADIACERARCYLYKEFEGELNASDKQTVGQSMIEINERVRDRMFYT